MSTAIIEAEHVEGLERIPAREEIADRPIGPEYLLAKALESGNMEMIDKMEELYWKRENRAAEAAFYAALSAFQSECPVIDKTKPVYNKDGRTVRYYYAPLGDIVRQVGTLLAKHGLSYDFSAKVMPFNELEGGPYMELTCHVHHSAGHSRSFPYLSLIEDNDYMNPTQHAGSANSYAKRYGFCNAFGILTADEDNDGNGAGKDKPCITEAQAADLQALAEEVGANRDQFFKYMTATCKTKVERFADIPAVFHKNAVAALEQKRKKGAK